MSSSNVPQKATPVQATAEAVSSSVGTTGVGLPVAVVAVPRSPHALETTATKIEANADKKNKAAKVKSVPAMDATVAPAGATATATAAAVTGTPLAADGLFVGGAQAGKSVALPVKKRKRSAEEAKVRHRAVERRRVLKINTCIDAIKGELESIGLVVRKDKASILNTVLTFLRNYNSGNKGNPPPGRAALQVAAAAVAQGAGGGLDTNGATASTDGNNNSKNHHHNNGNPTKKQDVTGAQVRRESYPGGFAPTNAASKPATSTPNGGLPGITMVKVTSAPAGFSGRQVSQVVGSYRDALLYRGGSGGAGGTDAAGVGVGGAGASADAGAGVGPASVAAVTATAATTDTATQNAPLLSAQQMSTTAGAPSYLAKARQKPDHEPVAVAAVAADDPTKKKK